MTTRKVFYYPKMDQFAVVFDERPKPISSYAFYHRLSSHAIASLQAKQAIEDFRDAVQSGSCIELFDQAEVNTAVVEAIEDHEPDPPERDEL